MTLGIFLYSFYELSSVIIRIVLLGYIPLRHSPNTAMAWLLAIYFWPWMGFLLYAALGSTALPSERIRRHESLLQTLGEKKHAFPKIPDDDSNWLPEDLTRFGALGKKLGDMSITTGNSFTLIDEAEEFLKLLCADVENAGHSVHLLFYIFARDAMTQPLFDALERAAARGVTCRVLVDAVGSKPFLKNDAKYLSERGIRVEEALPSGLLRRTPTMARYDLRNHRKIAVIDGRIGYTGSHNAIEPSYGGKAKGRLWRDLTLRLEGPVVSQLQGVFLEDWYVETREMLFSEETFPKPERTGNSVIQTVPSGPSYPWQNYQRLVVAALHGAKQRVVITTPYLIPDDELLHAMETAVLSDVRLQLVIPEKSDQLLVGSAAKAYFDELLAMGVEIYLFQQDILHSKTMSIDYDLAFLGTSNFDIRSFALNFELNLVLYGTGETAAIRMIQEKYIAASRRLTAEEWAESPGAMRVVHGVTKLFSPLL